MNKKCILVITDGIGHNANTEFNAFANARKPTFDRLFEHSAWNMLATSGLAVGLPEGQMGNSEVGHMTIGSGRILYQNLVKIDRAIEDGSLAKNPALSNLIARSQRVHVIGLYSDGGVHSHLRHFEAVADICKKAGKEVLVHAITDGRDVAPNSGAEFISNLNDKFRVATISGRFYAMDRDKRWERVQKAYEVIALNSNLKSMSPREYMDASYAAGVFDEFVGPASFYDFGGIRENDGVVFINFRNDRAREICAALANDDFSEFPRPRKADNLITMTKYDDNFKFEVMFAPEDVEDTLAQVISRAGLRQLHTAETEKYAHVTFFFNGGKEELVENETRVLVPSPKVATYDLQPEMSAAQVADAVLKGMESETDFIVVNFANGDMVGHTGNYEAAIKAVEAVDAALAKIVAKAGEKGYAYVQISDHGNCEAMRSSSGEPLTNHTTFDVYCFVVAPNVQKIERGGLSNVAATVLKLMGLEIPKVMEKPLF